MSQRNDHDRVLELACDRALVGLSPDGQAELAALLGAPLDGRALDTEIAAAAVDVAMLRAIEPMPAHLSARIWNDAGGIFAPSARGKTVLMPDQAGPMPAQPYPMPAPVSAKVVPITAAAPVKKPAGRSLLVAGWMAAAACLALALASWLFRPIDVAVAPTPTRGREELVAKAGDLVRAEWSAATDPTGRGVSGDVVWSNQEQRGYMRFRGLAANDKKTVAYQLWIFDAEQDERFPIDGGVFDVDAATGDVIVPITAKIRVAKPTLFAVTMEKPGGVVVSKRDRLVVTAAVKG